MIKVSGINHVVLHVQDLPRAKTFYTDLLGFEVYRENDRQAFMHCGSQGVALFKKQDDMPLTAGNDLNHMALDITSGTYEAVKAELEKHGVAVTGRPGDPHCIYFQDPDGHRLQLMVHA